MAIQSGRIAPATAYVAGTDAVSIVPTKDATHICTVSVDAAVTMFRRINGKNLTVAALTIDQANTFEWGSDDQTPYQIRFSGNCNINEFHIIQRKQV